MSTKIFFLNSDDANYGEEELNYVSTFFFEEGVLNTQGADWEDWVDNGDLLVEQRAAGANMSVDVGIGNAIVETTRSGVTFKAFVFSTAVENKPVPANSSGVNRVDAVILRVDRDVDPNALMNNVATVEYITGTNGATAMSDGQIQTALGDDDDFIRLADITVEDSETQILDADISDERVRAVSNDAITQSPTVLRFRSVATNPATANLTEGEMWYNSTDKEFKYYDGTQILVVDETLLPTADEKNALAGTGTPSGSNKYVTENNLNGIGAQTAGATINGETLPVPCYLYNTDDEWYACDADVQTKLEFNGFAVSNSTDGNTIKIQFAGVVGGFTGLTKGAKYYVQDAIGTIGTSMGTYEVLVGVAISTTEILIQKGKDEYMGTDTYTNASVGGNASDSVAVPSDVKKIIVYVLYTSDSNNSINQGGEITLTKKGRTTGELKSYLTSSSVSSVVASWTGATVTITCTRSGGTASIGGAVYFYR